MYERVSNLCKAHGITVRQLEKKLGFSNGTIGKWREGEPKLKNLTKVAIFFSASLDFIVWGITDD